MLNARRRGIRSCGGRIGQATDDGGCDWTCGGLTPLTDDNTAPGGLCAGCVDPSATVVNADDPTTLLTIGAVVLGILVVGIGVALAVDAAPAYVAARAAKAGASA
jgi:hypothetical protein